MASYRASFPGISITLKLHILEEHVVPWIRRWHFGLGFHGEQGAESIHTVFNALHRTYNSITNPTHRLKCMLKEHHLQISPNTSEQRPPIKKRKITNEHTFV